MRRRHRSPRALRSDGGALGPTPEMLRGHERARSGGEVRAALGPPAANHRTAGPGPHPQPEAVLLLPLPVVRLKRPLHAWPPRTAFSCARTEVGARREPRHTAPGRSGAQKQMGQCTPQDLAQQSEARVLTPSAGSAVGSLLACPQRANVPLPAFPVGPGCPVTSPFGRSEPARRVVQQNPGSPSTSREDSRPGFSTYVDSPVDSGDDRSTMEHRGVDRGYSSGR
jgi:hypothetical protein